MAADSKSVLVRIRGKVQGVWYRGWTVREVAQLNIDGWVRNRADGSVEAFFRGPADIVNAAVERCWQGPAGARVESVDISESDEIPEKGFHQAPTV